ncbi:DUF6049 family protein [Nocardioides sp. LS1]|uniref:DUF6049 family protein n=1 Tax=Nocardioides sp. LS1 TaxID=1027620 RepID=UPI000F616C6C|nr:DUF6049 family protein [Nocardioides sp. LS1]GCD90232.1 hypothetical protein NLS1_22380 [Nocardioides sp. LS1]
MVRPASLLPALVAAAAALAGPLALAGPASALPVPETSSIAAHAAVRTALHAAAPHPRAGAAPRYDAPLAVSIDTLTPAYVPRRGPIRVTGSVTNNSDEVWTDVRTYSFISSTPMTSAEELKDAAAVDPEEYVGDRVTEPGTFDTIDQIDPGASAPYSIKVPRKDLPVSAAGVYWFGVHALGATPEGRLDGADGRARTFLPLVDPTRKSVQTALVVPLRRDISWAPDGSLEDGPGWTADLAPGGRLRSLVDFGASAGSRPITWLLDPALPDAVRRLAEGNAPRSIAPTDATGPGATESPSPSDSASPSDGTTTSDQQAADSAATVAGDAWLDRLHDALRNSEILALPYGDLDVSAAAASDPGLYERARRRSGTTLAPWGLSMHPAIGAPSGYLSTQAIHLADPSDTVLVTDRMIDGDAPTVARAPGHTLVTTSNAAATGGPGPEDRLTSVALRQRIVSEAALRLLEPGRPPLVVVLPHDWVPIDTSGFFEGLDIPWLDLTTVSGAASRTGRAVPEDALHYPQRQVDRELDVANFTSAEGLVDAGKTLQNVLTQNTTVARAVADQAMTSTSYSARLHPDGSRASADRSREWIDGQLASIAVEAPSAVTLSSTTGRFAATVSNGLDQPVTVRIKALSDQPMTIEGPQEVVVAPHGRNTVLLNAHTSTLGVHNVTLVVTDLDGTPLGSSDQLPIRSAQVSTVIWVILGTGVVLLFGAIAVRLVRRVRAARRARTAAGSAA